MSDKTKARKPEPASRSVRPTKADVERAHNEGFTEGLEKGRLEIIEFLEHLYIYDEDRPDRDSPEGKAILDLVTRAGDHFRGRVKPNPHLQKKGRKR